MHKPLTPHNIILRYVSAPKKMKPDIDPIALLDAHQRARNVGTRMISVLVGSPSEGRATFGTWVRASEHSRVVVVPPGPTYDAAKRAISFAGRETALLIVPSKEALASAAATAMNIANEDRGQPVALVADFQSFETLMKDVSVPEGVRQAAFGGLVPLQSGNTEKLNALDPSPKAPPPYRSHHEYLLHILMIYDSAIDARFEVNCRVPGASWKKYEVDLWCAELKFAVEVDGAQHVTSPKQKALDNARDADLAKVGIKTRRILASAVMSDPTRTMKLVRDEVLSRAKEITQ